MVDAFRRNGWRANSDVTRVPGTRSRYEVVNERKVKMKTQTLLVEERALRCVEVTRTISLEVPVGYRSPCYLRARIAEGEWNYGPFVSYFVPVSETEKVGHLGLRVIGLTDEPADIPLVKESEVGA
jgi:hypothetical protein